jgi:glycosyltransferase involved in cell wall biosynthesis
MVNVARAMFETDRLPDGWLTLLEAWDEVWVPCRHNLDLFLTRGFPADRLRLLGQTMDFDAFHSQVEPCKLEVPNGHFVFLANFDFSERKGWRSLLRAWKRAFQAHDPVCLVLKTGSVVARVKPRVVRELIVDFLDRRLPPKAGGAAPVHVIPHMLPAADIPRLYAAADAYVSASRGEAWGRPYMEAMAMGLPTVGTRYGGNLDFMSDDNSWLVEGELVPVGEDVDMRADLYRGHRWFEADVDQLAGVLRAIASDPLGARQKAAKARRELIALFGPDVIARRVADWAREAAATHDLPRAGGRHGTERTLGGQLRAGGGWRPSPPPEPARR